jgi:hypothetical protein
MPVSKQSHAKIRPIWSPCLLPRSDEVWSVIALAPELIAFYFFQLIERPDGPISSFIPTSISFTCMHSPWTNAKSALAVGWTSQPPQERKTLVQIPPGYKAFSNAVVYIWLSMHWLCVLLRKKALATKNCIKMPNNLWETWIKIAIIVIINY